LQCNSNHARRIRIPAPQRRREVGRRRLWRGHPARDRRRHQTPMRGRSALHDLGSPGGERPRHDLDGRSHSAAGRPPQAHGPRHGQRYPGSEGLLQSGEPCQSRPFLGDRSRQGSVMIRLGWLFLSLLARALEPAERDVVLGDLAESGEGVGPATRHLLGLIVRRQVGLWLAWRPWLALLGVSCLAAVSLSRIVYRLNVDLHKHAAGYATSLTAGQEVAFLLLLAGAVAVWSWTCGFVLGSLSGRAVWLTWSVFYFVVLDSAWARFVRMGHIFPPNPHTHAALLDSWPGTLRLLMATTLPLSIAALLFAFPALAGAFGGVRRRRLTVHYAYLMASVNMALALFTTWST